MRLVVRWVSGADANIARPLTDEERRRAAAENPGIWRAHPDPRVGKPGWITATSDLWVLDRVRGVARTMNRWYQLGTEALEGRSLQ